MVLQVINNQILIDRAAQMGIILMLKAKELLMMPALLKFNSHNQQLLNKPTNRLANKFNNKQHPKINNTIIQQLIL